MLALALKICPSSLESNNFMATNYTVVTGHYPYGGNSIAHDSNNYLYLVVHTNADPEYGVIKVYRSTDGGATWAQLGGNLASGNNRAGQIAITNDDVVHVVYMRVVSTTYRIFERKWVSGAWTTETQIDTMTASSSNNNMRLVAYQDKLHLVINYESSTIGSGYKGTGVRYKYWNGSTWSSAIYVDGVSGDPSYTIGMHPAIIADTNGVLHLTFLSRTSYFSFGVFDFIHYRSRAADGTWSSVEQISTLNGGANWTYPGQASARLKNNIAYTSTGVIHVVTEDYDGTKWQIKHFYKNGSWTGETISTDAKNQGSPVIIVTPGTDKSRVISFEARTDFSTYRTQVNVDSITAGGTIQVAWINFEDRILNERKYTTSWGSITALYTNSYNNNSSPIYPSVDSGWPPIAPPAGGAQAYSYIQDC